MDEALRVIGSVNAVEYMRMKRACKYLDVGKSTAYEFIKRGYLKPIRLSAGVVVFKKSDLDEFIASKVG